MGKISQMIFTFFIGSEKGSIQAIIIVFYFWDYWQATFVI